MAMTGAGLTSSGVWREDACGGRLRPPGQARPHRVAMILPPPQQEPGWARCDELSWLLPRA